MCMAKNKNSNKQMEVKQNSNVKLNDVKPAKKKEKKPAFFWQNHETNRHGYFCCAYFYVACFRYRFTCKFFNSTYRVK